MSHFIRTLATTESTVWFPAVDPQESTDATVKLALDLYRDENTDEETIECEVSGNNLQTKTIELDDDETNGMIEASVSAIISSTELQEKLLTFIDQKIMPDFEMEYSEPDGYDEDERMAARCSWLFQ